MRLGTRSVLAFALPLLLGLHGPFLVVSQRGGPERVAVAAPHRAERIIHAGAYHPPHVAPSGQVLIAKYTDRTGERMRLVVTDGTSTTVLDETTPCVSTTAISYDGRLATYGDAGWSDQGCASPKVVHLVVVATGATLDLPAPAHAGWFLTDPMFSRDGSYLSVVGRERGKDVLWLYDTSSGERLRTLTGYRPTDLPSGLADGGGIVVRPTSKAGPGVRCRLFDLAASSRRPLTCWDRRLPLTKDAASGITLSPDGTTLAWVEGRSIVLAPVDDVTDRRVLGSAHTGPGTPTASWVSNRYVLTRSPEDDERSLRTVTTGHRLRWQPPSGIYGWTR